VTNHIRENENFGDRIKGRKEKEKEEKTLTPGVTTVCCTVLTLTTLQLIDIDKDKGAQ
jgi:hypothetical protein